MACNDNNVVVIAHTHLPSPGDLFICEHQIGCEKHTIPQPKAIPSYNFHINGVDIHDQMQKKYPDGRPSEKYWKYIMWFVVECCRVNAGVHRFVCPRPVDDVRYDGIGHWPVHDKGRCRLCRSDGAAWSV